MENVVIFIATAFFTGLLPIYPGAWGAALGVVLRFLSRDFSLRAYLTSIALLFAIGLVCAELAEGIYAQMDAKPIVIDELLGILLVLWQGRRASWEWFAGYLMFLSLDGLKPFPASWMDANMHGGLGIMLDDVVAGLYALLLLQLARTVVQRTQAKKGS